MQIEFDETETFCGQQAGEEGGKGVGGIVCINWSANNVCIEK